MSDDEIESVADDNESVIDDIIDEPLDELSGSETSEEPEDAADDLSDDEDKPAKYIVEADDRAPLIENAVKKQIIIVKPADRITSDLLQDFELTEAISIRSTHIAHGQPAMVNVDGMTDPVAMAMKEIAEGKCPLVLRRRVGREIKDGISIEYVEDRDINTMGKPYTHD